VDGAIRNADLTGYLNIIDDVTSGGMKLQTGALSVPERADLGLTVMR
jgi:hypothetical protein